ncbi:hypothetical protein CYG49_02780 [Candidatus Saccharibacteria bacterium]|nr:MAG: hypothetical protein CYG49_02780 [Candidatus Saccharibacteria bacterium]
MKKNVLIIEDDLFFGQSIERALRADFTTVLVRTAQAGLEQLDKHRIDVIVLDLFLSDANGIQFLHELRSYSDTQTVPVVICSTVAERLPREQMANYGVLSVLDKKTLTPALLRRTIREVALV